MKTRYEQPISGDQQERQHCQIQPAAAPAVSFVEVAQAEAVTPATLAAKPTPADSKRILPAPITIKHLLVPLDGTPEGEWTLPYATALARMLHAQVVLGHVTPTTAVNPLAQALHTVGSKEQQAQQTFAPQVLSYLHDLRWRLTLPIDQVRTAHISAPTVRDGLLDLVSNNEIDLVLLRLRTHYSAGNLSLGNVVDTLMRQSPIPVLVIPPAAEPCIRPFTLRHIVIPLDGSVLAESALAPLRGLLTQTQHQPGAPLTVTLLGVAENYAVLPVYQSYLDTIRARLLTIPACAHIQINAVAIVGSAPGAIVGTVEQGIVSEERGQGLGGTASTFVYAGPVDMLIMATHGRGGLDRWLFGSVASYVVPRVEVPVLLTHPVAGPR